MQNEAIVRPAVDSYYLLERFSFPPVWLVADVCYSDENLSAKQSLLVVALVEHYHPRGIVSISQQKHTYIK